MSIPTEIVKTCGIFLTFPILSLLIKCATFNFHEPAYSTPRLGRHTAAATLCYHHAVCGSAGAGREFRNFAIDTFGFCHLVLVLVTLLGKHGSTHGHCGLGQATLGSGHGVGAAATAASTWHCPPPGTRPPATQPVSRGPGAHLVWPLELHTTASFLAAIRRLLESGPCSGWSCDWAELR